MEKVFFDSLAILSWYKKQASESLVDYYLKKISDSEVNGLICETDMAEILSQIAVYENDWPLAEEFVQDLLSFVGLKKISIDWQTLEIAAKYQFSGQTTLPAAILLAAAKTQKAVIITPNPAFKQFGKEVEFIWV
jgi:predicted nucleic acid-binding protein